MMPRSKSITGYMMPPMQIRATTHTYMHAYGLSKALNATSTEHVPAKTHTATLADYEKLYACLNLTPRHILNCTTMACITKPPSMKGIREQNLVFCIAAGQASIASGCLTLASQDMEVEEAGTHCVVQPGYIEHMVCTISLKGTGCCLSNPNL